MLTKEEVIFEVSPALLQDGYMQTNGLRLSNTKSCAYRNINNSVNISSEQEWKTKSGACVKYVHSRVILYYNSCIELKWQRALHHCQSCDFGGEKGEGKPCGAIHYGLCTGVVDKLPVHKKLSAAVSPADCQVTENSSLVVSDNWQPTSTPTSHSSTLAVQTIQNGTSNNDNSPKDIRSEDNEKENTDAHNQNNNFTQIKKSFDSNSNSTKESQTKKRDNSKHPNTVIQNSNIPKFYYPMGCPVEKDDTEEVLLRVFHEFSKLEGGKAFKTYMGIIAKTCGLPLYWKCPLFMGCGGGKQGYITFQMFSSTWTRLKQTYHDPPSLFITLIAKTGTNYVEYEDLVPLIQDVVESHPGLMFLLEAPEFHSRYVNTVVARILYCVNRSWTGKITIPELRKSNFLSILQLLEEEDDINQILDYFSYEHFYVIYCKFWELDKDHDLFIDRNDLARHNDHAISSRMIDRIFSGAVTRGKTFQDGKMSYPEFVWFLLSEEDKKHQTSIEYWFRCMDLDGDGVISMYEMEYFYDEQMQKMETLGIERLPFEDCLCQMIDLVQPEGLFKITLWDLKKCKMTDIFFDTFMNLDKFLEHEQRDPFANLKDLDAEVLEQSDWEKYAAAEYEVLVAEEGTTEQEEMCYEDDFNLEEEDMHHDGPITNVTKTDLGYSGYVPRPGFGSGIHDTGDDIYNFSKSTTKV